MAIATAHGVVRKPVVVTRHAGVEHQLTREELPASLCWRRRPRGTEQPCNTDRETEAGQAAQRHACACGGHSREPGRRSHHCHHPQIGEEVTLLAWSWAAGTTTKPNLSGTCHSNLATALFLRL